MKKTKFNIAMFGQKRIPSREGGVEIVVKELAKRLVNKGYSVTCFNRGGQHVAGSNFDIVKCKSYMGIKIKDVFTINYRGLAAVTSSICASFWAAFGNYDIVHIHAEGPAFMCWLPKLMGKKVVVTIHGLDWARQKWGRLASWYIKYGEKNAVKYADEIIVLSENNKKYFWEEYGKDTIFIPNGVSRHILKDACEIKKWHLDKNEFILYLGRIVPEKGIHYLISAFKDINTDKNLVIAGGASDTNEYFRELKALAAGDERIIFTDFVQGKVLEELYSNCYVYCLPSDLEGMPLSLLEAMSYGNCCLVSNIPECTEVVEDMAVVFSKGDKDDLKRKIEYLLDNDSEVVKLKSTASDYICSKYNWNDVADATIKVYEGIKRL